jgi:hypothetical protein
LPVPVSHGGPEVPFGIAVDAYVVAPERRAPNASGAFRPSLGIAQAASLCATRIVPATCGASPAS